MAWSADDAETSRSRDELLGRVRRRGEEIRRRRRAGRACVAALVASLAVGATVLSAGGGSPPTELATDVPSTTPPVEALPEPLPVADDASTTITTAAAVASSVVEPAPTSIGRPPLPPTPLMPGTSAPSASPSTARPPVAAGPPSTPLGPKEPSCGPTHLVAAATTSKTEYGPGEVVQMTSTLRNRTTTRCWYPEAYGFSYNVKDSTGRGFIAGDTINEGFDYLPLEPGAALTQTEGWSQIDCPGTTPCARVPPGEYRYTAFWRIGVSSFEAPAAFRLVP